MAAPQRHWTAPADGWYDFSQPEPRRLSDGEVAALDSDLVIPDAQIVRFGTRPFGRTAWSAAPGNLQLPSGQVVMPRAETHVVE